MILNKDLKRRIIDISYRKGLSHLGSCLTAVDIIDEIFKIKKSDEKFILSSGHAALALYVVLEKVWQTKYIGNLKSLTAEERFNHHGVHPDRCLECGIDCSAGSLGHGIGIAVGMALADRLKNVYCLISDGECAEGSVWEALRIIIEQQLFNLKVYVNFNGYAAYRPIQHLMYNDLLHYVLKIRQTNFNLLLPILKEPQEAHYVQLDKEKYEIMMGILK